MDIRAYLQRIHYDNTIDPTAHTLQSLHMAHLLSVPFENLDIALGRAIILDEDALFAKIVSHHRGGFCYEANGVFAVLLRELGFSVSLLSAQVAHDDGSFGPACDHLTLLVALDQPRLVDVGFGDSFRQPLLLADGDIQVQPEGTYRLLRAGPQWTLLRDEDGLWRPQYRFMLESHTLADFAEMCHYHQTSPASHFTRQRICTIATAGGRVTLSDMRLISTQGKRRSERLLADEQEYDDALHRHFGITLAEAPHPHNG